MILGNNAVVRKIKQFVAQVHTNRQSIYREPVTFYFFLDSITTAGFRILLLTTIVKSDVIVNIYAD